MTPHRFIALGLTFVLIGFEAASNSKAVAADAVTPTRPAPNMVAIEALSRLKGMDLEANPSLKTAVLKVVETTRGTPMFVELVRDFKLTGQEAGLLEVIEQQPGDSLAAEAARMLLAEPGLLTIIRGLKSPGALTLVQALGNAGERSCLPVLSPLLADEKRDPLVRKAVVKALSQIQEGAAWLLDQAKSGTLPESVRFVATTELNQARWPQIRTEAAKVLPLPSSQGAEPLPPVGELVKRKGDATKGAAVFRRDTVACIKCHQVAGEGVDFGPALSEIGTKLGKEALYESILDPSAGISFGFEAWQVELKSGDEAYGLIASETEDEIAVKTQNGVVSKYRKADIQSREKMKLSIMPAGLQQSMSTQDLVDLVEYLSSLKKK